MLYRRFRIATTLAILLSATLMSLANAAAPSVKIDPVDMKDVMSLKDVKPGMVGYGLSVFRGVTPEKFQVKVLGVLNKAYFGGDLILVRLTGGPMTSRGANLIEGMSGSPIYINGKLIGAFSMGYPFGKEPIGMVTPIQYMLDAWDPTLPARPSSFFPFSTMNLEQPVSVDGHSYSKVTIDDGQSNENADAGTLMMQPLATPLMVSGMSPRMMNWLQDSLKPLNIRPVAGPGLATDKASLSPEMKPGAAVGVSFVTGDVQMSGIGTVTYRRGDRVLAFGHPMFTNPMMNGLGAVQAPMTTAYVYDVYPSLQISSKIAAPIKSVGTIFQDRPWSIAGRLGSLPKDMIPVTVLVNDRARSRSKAFNVRVINHPMLAPSLIVGATGEAIFEMRGSPSDAMASVKLEVVADEVGTIRRQNTFFDPISIDMASVGELHQILSLLQMNPFYPVGVKKVNVTVDIIPKHQTARLDHIFLKESKFEPGDTVQVGVVLKPFKGERITKTIDLKLPNNMPDGRVSIDVYGGGMARTIATSQDSGDQGPTPMAVQTISMSSLDNLQQLLKKFLEREKNDDLVARIVLPKSVPSISGEKLSGLPPSIAEAMKSTKATAVGTDHDDIKTVVSTDWVISGAQRLSITVQKKDMNEKKSAAKKPSDSSSSGSSESDSSASSADESSDGSSPDSYSLETGLGAPRPSELVADTAPDTKTDTEVVKVTPTTEEDSAKKDESAPSTSEAAKPAAPTATTDEKPVGRAPVTWTQTSKTDFQPGTFTNVTATTGDLLMLSGSLKSLYESSEPYFWSVLPDGKGNTYVGTGNKGIIYKVTADGAASVFYDSPELEIHSLAMDAAGNLYAGTSPNGIVYKISPDGKATNLFDADEKYITALALDSKGNVYAATGDKCKVYKISTDGKSQVVLNTTEDHALSLAVDKDDNVYVGTGLDGVIYKVPSAGNPTVLYDAAEDSITALAVDTKGVLYAGTSPKGVVYRIAPGTTPKAVYDKADKGIAGIAIDDLGNVYAASSASIYEIMPDDTVSTVDNDHDLQFMSIALRDGRLYAGTGNAGSIYTAEVGKVTQGTFESPVHDCGLSANWGIASWTADTPAGTSVVLQTRTGNEAVPDATWSDWSAACGNSGSKITSPAGRYIQYLVTLRSDSASVSPKVKDVNLVYLSDNQPPKLTLSSPKSGEKWSGKKSIKWTGTDPDKDTLDYQVYCSGDNGATWQQIADTTAKAAPTQIKTQATEGETSDPQQMLARMAAELDKHPEIPQDVKDKILAEAPSLVEEGSAQKTVAKAEPDKAGGKSQDNGQPVATSTKQTSLSWDTTKVKDGTYLVKIVASDRISNPVGALTDEAISDPITVTNSAPKVIAFKKTLTIQADKSVRIEGFATQDITGIAGVQYRIDSDDNWASAAASDGIFDSGFESFVVTTQSLSKGEHTIEIKAIDQAGNAATTSIKATVN